MIIIFDENKGIGCPGAIDKENGNIEFSNNLDFYDVPITSYLENLLGKDELSLENENISIFDVRKCPHYIPNVRGNGIFIEDIVHYTSQTNRWVAEQILNNYK